jgi:phosphoribosylanthranilate isomerase
MLQQLAHELRMYASISENRCLKVLMNVLPDLQHQFIIGEEIVTFFSASHLIAFDIVTYHHDHPDAYWVAWKRENAIKDLGIRYIRLEEADLLNETTLLQTINTQLFKSLKLKVCGMRDHKNIIDIAAIGPHYLGFICYKPSKRDIGEAFQMPLFDPTIAKVGVFVDADADFIIAKIQQLHLQAVQLHGNESTALCEQLKSTGIKVIKVFSVDDDFDFTTTVPYEAVSDYFLFDTKGKAHGGNGVKFNWALLKQYNGSKPLFLSGGIDLEDLPIIAKLNLLPLNLYALDVNSKFELEPALKDVLKVKQLKDGLHQCN